MFQIGEIVKFAVQADSSPYLRSRAKRAHDEYEANLLRKGVKLGKVDLTLGMDKNHSAITTHFIATWRVIGLQGAENHGRSN